MDVSKTDFGQGGVLLLMLKGELPGLGFPKGPLHPRTMPAMKTARKQGGCPLARNRHLDSTF